MLRTVTSYSQRSPKFSRPFGLPHVFARQSSSQEHGSSPPNTNVSDKLWADAAEEEATQTEQPTNKPPPQVNEYPNWTGEESVQDTVLRMLVDKYKPLRGVSIRTAEEKLKATPPSLWPSGSGASSISSTPISVNATSQDTHKPWLTTFRAPSHATSIRHMRLPPSPPISRPRVQEPPIHPDDSRSRIEERERKKKAAFAGRLTNARESSLDYRLSKTSTAAGDPRMHRPNPVSVKGWTSLVEERIERARNEGHFRSIKGRGRPITRENEESNPFIPREEFLMNRIVQRQGAAPPWVEIQGELEAAIASFRAVLRSSWTRRAIRTLTHERPPALLPGLSLADVTNVRMRDPEWEAREASYHAEALNEVNALVRKYNGVAPYAVRRAYLDKRTELDRMYVTSGEDVLAEIKRRTNVAPAGVMGAPAQGGEGGELEPFRFNWRHLWAKLVAKLVGS